MSLVEDLKWRYATKKFDASKKITQEDLVVLKESIQLAATSYGLQLFKVLVVENEELRKKLKPASWEQTQITDASHLLVLCQYKDVKDAHIDEYINLKASKLNIDPVNLKGYGDFMKVNVLGKSEDELKSWMAKQVYIALGNVLASAAELKIDTCPIEGFDATQYDEILGLDKKGLTATVVTAVGYRSAEDDSQHAPKVRKPLEELFETV